MNWRGLPLKIMAIALLFAVLLSACKDSRSGSAGSPERLRELGDALLNDLQTKILPNRDDPSNLLDYGFVVSSGDKTAGAGALAEFFEEYESGGDSEVTAIFAGKSFVVSRVTFVDGAGYYLRYEYDKLNPGEVDVGVRLIDGIGLEYSDNPPKWDMRLIFNKKQVAHFVFRNPDDS